MKALVISLLFFGLGKGQQSPYGQCGGIGWSGATTCTLGWTCVPQPNNPYYSQCLPNSVSSTSPSQAQQTPYGQCGGIGWSGPSQCTAGWACFPQANNPYYSQCLLASSSSLSSRTIVQSTSSTFSTSSVPPSSPAQPQQTPYGQCGGIGWSGPVQCTVGWSCIPQSNNPYYSQCLPDSTASATTSPPATTLKGTTTAPTASSSTTSPLNSNSATSSTTVSSQSCAVSNAPPSSAGKVTFSGINIAGFDFGCSTDGTCSPGGAYPPLGNGQPDGPGQMVHFVKDGFNIFRLPVGWQYLINNMNLASGNLDPTNFGLYDTLVQACLSTGAHCVIDIHNYARFSYGAIIGQGGPSDAQFASLWASLATKYKSQSKVMFGIMNEPHDLNDFPTWAITVQAAVTAIRNTGATSQTILLPGTNYASVANFLSTSAPALSAITNPDGTTTGLVFDIHKYLDSDGSGTNAECVSNWIQDAFAPLAQYLRCHGRQAFLTETGGGNTQSCVGYLCQTIAYLNQNSDVYLGYIGWAAGSFDQNYVLSETPDSSGKDKLLVSSCLMP